MSAKDFRRWAVTAFSLVLVACGGGGGGSEQDGQEKVLSGVVEDGPVVGARVYLKDRSSGETLRVCGASGIGRCETLADENGAFFLRVSNEVLSQPLELVTSGGMDTDTGVSFDGMPLRTPLELFEGAEDRIAITPLTSLLAARMRAEPDSSTAYREMALELGLAEGDLTARPSSRPDILQRTLLLTAIGIELAETGEEDPFALMGKKAASSVGPILLSGQANPARLKTWFDKQIADEVLERLQETEKELQAEGGSLSYRFRKAALVQALKKTLKLMAEEGLPSGEAGFLNSNLRLLSDKILQGSGPTVIPLRGMASQRVSRYVLFEYDLVSVNSDGSISIASLSSSPLPPGTDAVAKDPKIAELAQLKALHSVSVPLLKSEMPGNDNRKRLEYFYNSDISPFYIAEKFAGEIADDRVSDLVMLEVAEGKASAGLLKEARLIVDTQIFQSQQKAIAYDKIASIAIDLGELKEALEIYELCEFFMREHYGLKPPGSLTNVDYAFIQKVASQYKIAGNNDKWKEITEYLKSFIPANPTSTLYGIIIVESWRLVDEYIASNELGSARDLLEFMEKMSMETPSGMISGRPSFKAKVLYLKEIAKRYASLGLYDKVDQIYDAVNLIRTDPPTMTDTWVYMPDFVEILYQRGRREEALQLAEEIPASNSVLAKKLVATYEAVSVGVENALLFVETQFPSPAERVDALTYSQANPGRGFIAQVLLEAGRVVEARKALDAAASLLPALDYPSDTDRYTYIVQRGYVKIAELYRQINDTETAVRLLGQAEEITSTLGGLQNRVSGLLDIRAVYMKIGRAQKADELFLEAFQQVEASKGIVVGADRAAQIERLATISSSMPNREFLARLLPPLAEATRDMVAPSLSGTARETALAKQVDQYLKTAKHALLLKDDLALKFLEKTGRKFAYDLLEEAVEAAGKMAVAASRVSKFNNPNADSILGVYAAAGYLDRALKYLPSHLTTPHARNVGYQSIARAFTVRDDFPGHDSASIDTDGDLFPDFFHPLRAVDIGLELDQDSDDDGIPDVDDRRPFFHDFKFKA